MDIEEIREIFCTKIWVELERFKRRTLKMNPEEIYNKAYHIDCIINIYELLMEKSQKLGKDELKILTVIPNLLALLYSRWLKREDGYLEELWNCLEEVVAEICEPKEERSVGVA